MANVYGEVEEIFSNRLAETTRNDTSNDEKIAELMNSEEQLNA